MSAVPVDFTVSARWIVPMVTAGAVLENHTLVVRDGRILDVLPTPEAARYAPLTHVDRSSHVLLPGLVDAYAPLSVSEAPIGRDAALLRMAAMLSAGTTTFYSVGAHADQEARVCLEQGMRAVIGMTDDSMTRALALRDDYRGHPNIATTFAAQSPNDVSDEDFGRMATLADELDAGIVCVLHASADEVERCVEQHGRRPLDRLRALGLLTPALTAVSMAHVNEGDVALARHAGVAVTLCPAADVLSGNPPAPVATWAASGLRLALGSGRHGGNSRDLWSAVRLHTAFAAVPAGRAPRSGAWEALDAATRGGAAVLGWEAEIGTLEPGKWADVCAVDLASPAMLATLTAHADVVTQLVYNGGRDSVSDVWIAGRHLLDAGKFTRLDWPALAGRTRSLHSTPLIGDSP